MDGCIADVLQREAVLAGRVCVRDGRACSFEARAPRGPWKPLGSSFQGVDALEVRAVGDDIAIKLNSQVVASPKSGEAVRISVNPGVCSVLRAELSGGASAPIYANCPFAKP